MSPSTATLQGGSCIGRLAEQSPLTGYEPKSLIDVSREHTPIILPSRRGSLDTNVDDLATTLDASEVCDTTDVGRLTSPLFSQEREVSAIPLGVLFLRHLQARRHPGEMLSSFQASGSRCRKVKATEIWRVCRIVKWKGKNSVRTKRHSRLP